MAGDSRVIVYTRTGCHLCEDAITVCAEVCGEAGIGYTVKDVDTDPQLRELYTDHVPVTVVDGDVLSYWFLDRDTLAERLTR